MKSFWQKVRNANRVYDRYPEAQRIIVGAAVMSPAIVLLSVDPQIYPIAFYLGAVYCITAIAFRTESRWRRQ